MADSFGLTRRAILFSPIVLAACGFGPDVVKFAGTTMGTSYTVVAIDHARAVGERDLRAAVTSQLLAVNREMSNWDARSEISQFNAARTDGPFSVSDGLAQVADAARKIGAATQGRFDLTLGPLIELWGFGAKRGAGDIPTEAAIADALGASGGVERLADGTLRKTAPDVEIYVSALGKGHGVDRIAAALEGMGIRDYFIEVGGDIVTAGLNADGQPWQIGIEVPVAFDRGIHEVVGVSGLGVATSGDYRNYFEKHGQRYSHILDPKTGYPVTHNTASATVAAPNAMLADAWSTAMLVLGRESGMEVAEEHGLAAMFIERSDDAGSNGFVTTSTPQFEAIMSQNAGARV